MAGQDNKKTNGENANTNNETVGPPTDENDINISEEYVMLDSKLDELNTALDFLEQQNDDIHEKLKELLQSSIEIRKELRNENKE